MTQAKWSAELGIDQWNDEEAKGKMVIKLDDGEEWIVEVRGGGWIKDCESGRKIRMKRLGCLRSLKAKKENDKKAKKKRKACDVCGEEFPSEVSWLKHVESGRCKKMEDMSEKELRRRRVTRMTAAAKRGEKIFDIEPIEMRSYSGGVAQSCGSFTYVGSLTDVKGSLGSEIRRRIKKAGEAVRGAWILWRMKGLSLKLKGRLYSVFVHLAML